MKNGGGRQPPTHRGGRGWMVWSADFGPSYLPGAKSAGKERGGEPSSFSVISSLFLLIVVVVSILTFFVYEELTDDFPIRELNKPDLEPSSFAAPIAPNFCSLVVCLI